MTTNELFDKITSEPKWWAGKVHKEAGTKIKRKHREGRYTNYEWLFGLFGYVQEPSNWVKIDYVFIDESTKINYENNKK